MSKRPSAHVSLSGFETDPSDRYGCPVSESKKAAVANYAAEIAKQLGTGQAAEHAYRPALKNLVEELASVDVVNDPKRSEFGAPDFVFLRRKEENSILGWAETKDLQLDLNKVEKSEQLQRYTGYPNLFLTNYLEFRFYGDGHRYAEVTIGGLSDGSIEFHDANYQALADELVQFMDRKPQPISSGVRLAEIMGAKARRIRHNVEQYLIVGDERTEELLSIFRLIRENLVHDIDEVRFADMYSQTLVYGLFAARYYDKSPDDFSRSEARDLVPPSNPFLRQFFDHIAGANFDSRLAYIVDELCEVFRISDVEGIVHRHLAGPVDDRDPIIHFYEDFLKAYDPDQRKRMGAYYTPLPIVDFMIRTVDAILKNDFDLADGLADTSKITKKIEIQGKKVLQEFHEVQILDPAVGTATFLNEIVKFVRTGFAGQEGRWPAYARDDLIPRLNGFELMMAPYTVAHLKLGLTLKESGVSDFGKRLGVYLTNTLEEGLDRPQNLFQQPGLAGAVATEAVIAGEIKNERPIMVVIGNPPYSGVSSNETSFANSLVDRYKVEPGGRQKLVERKHWLNDDYVKFIAFAEAMISKCGAGIVSMITNHGYLDNPTFRGMRWRLLSTFDEILVLDLHGNAKKKEVAPDGSPDENVFNIQQGVAIIVGVKHRQSPKSANATVRRADLYGSRASKFTALKSNEVKFDQVVPVRPYLSFTHTGDGDRKLYETGPSIPEIFPLNTSGIVTMGDAFIVSEDREILRTRLHSWSGSDQDAVSLKSEYSLGKNYAAWITGNRPDIQIDDELICPILYRPFDRRWTYFDNQLVWRPRTKIFRHLLAGQNLALVTVRRVPDGHAPPYVFCSRDIVVNGSIRSDSTSIDSAYPLYLFDEDGSRIDNISVQARKKLEKNLSNEMVAQDLFDYVYGILHSPSYREKYSEYLQSDFPRVPIPRDDTEFEHFKEFGCRLRKLHLLESEESKSLETTYPEDGSNRIEKIEHENGKLWINDVQYFGGVPESAWNCWVGGYQPVRKWLKDRKGRVLASGDIEHFQRIVKVMCITWEMMAEIDG